MTEEIKCGPEDPQHDCPYCAMRAEEEAQSDELNLAILIALVPALTITLFNSIGFF